MRHIEVKATYRIEPKRIVVIGRNILATDLQKLLFSDTQVPCEIEMSSINNRGLPILNVIYASFNSREDLQYYFMLNSHLYKELINAK